MNKRAAIFEKSARKKTYSRRKHKPKESLLVSDDEVEFTNVDELLKEVDDDPLLSDDESEEAKTAPPELETITGKKSADVVDPLLPPLVDSKDNMLDEEDLDPAVVEKEEREAIQEARKLVADEKESSEPTRRSKRQKKKTPKMRIQEAAVKSKSKPHATTSKKPKKKRASGKSTKGRKADITEVSEGSSIRLFWEPTQSWSNGIVTQDWKDGYFTIEFEDDVKEQGALSYKLAEYEWFIEAEKKATSKKGRKRKRNKDGDYTDDAAAAPTKKTRFSGEVKNNSALEDRISELKEENNSKDKKIEEMEATIVSLEATIVSLQKDKAQYEGEKAEITKVLDTIELKEFKSTDVLGKLKHILNNYKAESEVA